MNAKEFEAMRRRLHERRVAQETDSPMMLGLATILFAALAIIVNFI